MAHKTKKWNIKVKKTKQTEKIGGKMDRPKNKKKRRSEEQRLKHKEEAKKGQAAGCVQTTTKWW